MRLNVPSLIKSRQKALQSIGLLSIVVLSSSPSFALDENDRLFLVKTIKSGLTNVELGSLAGAHASSSQVKAYGDKMKREHLAMNEKFSSFASSHGVEGVSAIHSDGSEVSRLENTSKEEFDREYLESVISDHKLNIAQFSSQARDTQDPAVAQLANEVVPSLRKHLKQAEEIQKALPSNPPQ